MNYKERSALVAELSLKKMQARQDLIDHPNSNAVNIRNMVLNRVIEKESIKLYFTPRILN